MTASTDYTAQEIIVVAGAKVLEDNKIVFVGTGLPIRITSYNVCYTKLLRT